MIKAVYKIQYQDKWLILLGVPVITFLNYYLNYSTLRLNSQFLLPYSVDIVQGYVAWYSCKAAIHFLDKFYPWEKSLFRRMTIQIPVVCITLFTVTIGLKALVTFFIKPVPAIFFTFNIYIFLIWSFFLNVLYLSLYLYNNLNAPLEKSPFGNRIWIKIGMQNQTIDLDHALYFYTIQESVYIVLPRRKQLLPGYTLDKIQELADASKFFRINSHVLIGRDLIKNIKFEENGNFSVALPSNISLPETIQVSRLTTPALEQWMNKNTSSIY